MKQNAPSERTRVKRGPKAANYDRDMLNAVLDAGMLCHVAYIFDGYPVITPTFYWREGDFVYWHSSSASRMINVAEDIETCFAVTHLDGLVLARSAFAHSANYRSVIIFGRAQSVEGDDAKLASLKAMMESLYPGRWDELRPVSRQELKGTQILRMSIDEASVKMRTGDPIDVETDKEDDVWAGLIPFRLTIDPPHPDPFTATGTRLPPALPWRLVRR